MLLNLKDVILLLHPIIAVALIFPLMGMVVKLAWQTRQRRLENANRANKSTLPATVGSEHVALGRWLTGSVVGIVLLALGNHIYQPLWTEETFSQTAIQLGLITLFFGGTITSLCCLYRAQQPQWRGGFATLSGMGLIVLGAQQGVYRNSGQWYLSHYYYGIGIALLLIFSLAIAPDIYRDRTQRWRKVHIILNCMVLLLFLGQSFTGTRSLLEVPLSWQQSYIEQCNFTPTSPTYKTCPGAP